MASASHAFAGARAHRPRHRRRRGSGRRPADALVRRMVGTPGAARTTTPRRHRRRRACRRRADDVGRHGADAVEHARAAAPLEPRRDRFVRPRSHAGRRRRSAHASATSSGPAASSRAMAIVHIAMFEVVNAIDRRYESYLGLPAIGTGRVDGRRHRPGRARHAGRAVSRRRRRSAIGCWRPTWPRCRTAPAKKNGVLLGRAVAAAILLKMRNDGSNHAEPLYGVDYIAGNGPGEWRQDPISLLPPALGARWGTVRPFVAAVGPSHSARRPAGAVERRPTPPPTTR